jgi:hypothetical protein
MSNVCLQCGNNHYLDRVNPEAESSKLGPFTVSTEVSGPAGAQSNFLQEIWQGRPIPPVNSEPKTDWDKFEMIVFRCSNDIAAGESTSATPIMIERANQAESLRKQAWASMLFSTLCDPEYDNYD